MIIYFLHFNVLYISLFGVCLGICSTVVLCIKVYLARAEGSLDTWFTFLQKPNIYGLNKRSAKEEWSCSRELRVQKMRYLTWSSRVGLYARDWIGYTHWELITGFLRNWKTYSRALFHIIRGVYLFIYIFIWVWV